MHSSRRKFLAFASAASLTSCATDTDQSPEAPSRLGEPVSAYGERAEFEKASRLRPSTPTPEEATSLTPLADSHGILTPSALHFERHHSGVPELDPQRHELLIHGLVERPLVFTLDDLKRLPSASRIHFLECAGNSRSEWGSNKASTVQVSHGQSSCSEWTGVTLRLVLEEAGLKPEAKWLMCEGGDSCRMARSLPVEKALDDCLLAYGQNGEAIRPEQGYPLRLLVPGWEGNISVKWLRRIKAVEEPVMARDETSKYTDVVADGKARQFTFTMEAKSVITHPSGGQSLDGPGFYEIRGLAWSGARAHRKGCSFGRRGRELAGGRSAGAEVTQGVHALSASVALGGRRGLAAVSSDRRNRLRAADGRGADRGARQGVGLSQQWPEGVEGRGGRKGDRECLTRG